MPSEKDGPEYALAGLASHEAALVRELGERIGYGRTMQLCEQIWAAKCRAEGMPNAAHASYCCASFLVACPGCEQAEKRGEHCEWCCGAGRVTKRVAEEISRIPSPKPSGGGK